MYGIFHSGSAHPLKVRAGCFAEVEYLYPSPKKSWWRKGLNLFRASIFSGYRFRPLEHLH